LQAFIYRRFDQAEWTLKIEKESHGGTTTIRLIGHFQLEHVDELKRQIQENGPQFVLDLKEVTLVDVDVIRFLEACETCGVKIVHCSRYIREWMTRERQAGAI
jgi:anti-anti-sigma regulatory factor